MSDTYSRTAMLLGDEAMAKLRRSHVAVFGLGGVGSFAAEALARGGVGELTLVDSDVVSESNINRQLIALRSTVGQPKCLCMAARIADIDPDTVVHPIYEHYSAENRERFFASHFDYIVDAIDLVSCKIDLIMTARELAVPIISALGTGNKLDPSRFTVTDISKTVNCPLARVMRRELRARGVLHHKVVYSPEEALHPDTDETPPPGRRSIPGSVSWVPGAAGLMLAGAVIRDLTGI